MSLPQTYDELVVAVRDYQAITSGSEYEGAPAMFIGLAESRFNAKLRTRRQQTSYVFTPDSAGEAPAPADYAGFHRARESGSPIRRLAFVSPDWMDDEYPTVTSGRAQHITVDGELIRLRPLTGQPVTFRYYGTIPALSVAQPTNWLLTNFPGLYIAAASYELAQFFNDEENAARFATMMADQMALVEERDAAERAAGLSMRVRGPTP